MLYEDGMLSVVVTPYLEVAGYSVDWWDNKRNSIDWNWIASRMCDPDTCENRNETRKES